MRTRIILILSLIPFLLKGNDSGEPSLQNTIDNALQNNCGIIDEFAADAG